MPEKMLFVWSGGKDSALALQELLQWDHVEISALLTTVTRAYDRVSMHGVRRSLVKRQAESLGFPLEVVYLSEDSSNHEYEKTISEILLRYRVRGVFSVAFGDIHLWEVRHYRERHLAEVGMKAVFPLWGRDTATLMQLFVQQGFKAIVSCVDARKLERSFVGRMVNGSFLADLPPGIDPCGENGEYHSFVFDGPIFQQPIPCEVGEVVARGSFYFCDLLPARCPLMERQVPELP